MSVTARARSFFDGSMRANAVALVANQLASASLGFVYWLLAARLYSVEVVGMSSAVISTVQLVSGLAQFGLVNGMQRFIPRAGRRARRLALASYLVVTVAAIVAGVVAIFGAALIAPDQAIFGSVPPVYIVLAAVAWTLFYLQDGVLIGLREAVWVFVENFAYNFSKIVLLVVGAQLLTGSGIIASWFVPAPIAVLLVSVLIFGRLLRPERLRDHEDPNEHVTAREIIASASGDHIGGMVAEAGLRVLPLLVVRLAGVEANAYFYQAWMISTVLGLVASGMANSFTADTAADRRRVTPNSRTILRTMSLLLVPAALLVGVAAPLVLRVFGEAYAREGAGVLRILAVAVVPVIVNTWYVSYLRVMGHIRRLIGVRIVSTAVLVGLSYVGLQTWGIEGVGVAWLVSQTGVALYAVVDQREVLLRRRSKEQRERSGAMRRGDWRFLLPVPHPRKTAVFAEGALARSTELLKGRVLPSASPEVRECDLVVADNPDAAHLGACLEALRPGGTLYAEWHFPRLGGTNSVTDLLARAGFEDVVLYWPAPRASKAKLWVRVPTPSERYREILSRLLADAAPRPWMGRLVARLTAMGLRIGLVPAVVSLARKPGVASPPTQEFCSWLESKLAPSENASLLVIMRTGGESDENKVNWLVYAGEESELRWIAKAPRHPASLPALQREYDMLSRLATRTLQEQAAIAAPRGVLQTDEPGFPLFVQSAVQGTPLLRVALSRGYPDVAQLLSSSLATLGDPSWCRPAEEWWPEHVEPWLRRLQGQLDGIGDTFIVQQVRDIVSGASSLPLGWTHNDCTPWNTMVTEEGLAIFDWESANERGLPLVDLVYALATTAFSLDGTEGTSRSIDSYRRLLDSEDERERAFAEALSDYGDALRLQPEDVSRLRVMTWVLHTTHDLHNLLGAAESPGSELLGECVCLPVLQAEVRRHLAEFTPAAASSHDDIAEALFISPHLDDAILSCGTAIHRLVARGAEVTMATVFTADLPAEQQPSLLALSCHEVWGTPVSPFAARREEDLQAAAVLGIGTACLGFRDAVYRRDDSGRQLYDCSQREPVKPADLELSFEPLRASMETLLAAHPSAVVFCPAALGGHVDHVLVRRAVEAAAANRHVVYYDEYPYLSWGSSTRRVAGLQANVMVLHPTPDEIEAHLAASACYTTQIPGLFPSLSLRVRRIIRHRLPRACGWMPIGPDRFETALRRMERQTRHDKASYGERYSWRDPDWAGPFRRSLSARTP